MKRVVSPYFRLVVDEEGRLCAVFVDGTVVPLVEPVFHQPEPVELKRLDTEVYFS